MPNRSHHDRDRGFTLLEVIVSFTLMALVLGTAFAAMSGGLRAQVRTGTAMAELDLARSTLARIGHELPFASARFADPDTGARVSVEIMPYQPAASTWAALGTAPYLIRVRAGGAVLETLRTGPVQ